MSRKKIELKDKENSTIITNKIHDIQDANLILDILGNSTRRRILILLSKEPLYFNQLSKIIGIGQQSILRHMKILEDSGLIETYTQESNLGAPNRKYYRLATNFSMSMAFSKDGFSIRNNKIKELRYKEFEKLYKEYEKYLSEYHSIKNKNFHRIGLLLDLFKNTLIEIEKEITDYESKINDLQALRQLILQDIHKIGKDNFEFLERRIIYSFIDKQTPSSVEELTNILNEDAIDIKNSVKSLITSKFKEDKTSIFKSLKNYKK